MKLIEIKGKNAVGYYAQVDDEDYEKVNKHNWYLNSRNGSTYAYGNIARKTPLMHRWITGALSGEKMDHIDGNGLNNQKSNLRKATHSQNMANQKTSKNKYLGIYKYRSGWKAVLQKDNIQYRSLICTTEEKAAVEYNKLAIKYHGEYARLNTIKPVQLEIQ